MSFTEVVVKAIAFIFTIAMIMLAIQDWRKK